MIRTFKLLAFIPLFVTGCGDSILGDRVDTRSVRGGGIWSSDAQQIAHTRTVFEELTGYKKYETSAHRFYLHSADAERPEERIKWAGPIDGYVKQLYFMTGLADGEDYMLVKAITADDTFAVHQVMANGDHRVLRDRVRGFIDAIPSPDGTVLAFVESWLYCDRRAFNIRFMDAQSNQTLDSQRWEFLGSPRQSSCVDRPAMGTPALEADMGNHPLTGFQIAWADESTPTLMIGFRIEGRHGPRVEGDGLLPPFPPTLTTWNTTVGGVPSSEQLRSAVCFSPATTSSRFGPDGSWVNLETGTTIEALEDSGQELFWGQADTNASHQALQHGCI